MEVVDRLAALGAGADRHAISFAQALLARHFSGGQEQPTHERSVSWLGGSERSYVLFRNHKNMGGRFGVDIVEGQHLLVFPDLLCRDGAGDDFAEDAVHKRALWELTQN